MHYSAIKFLVCMVTTILIVVAIVLTGNFGLAVARSGLAVARSGWPVPMPLYEGDLENKTAINSIYVW